MPNTGQYGFFDGDAGPVRMALHSPKLSKKVRRQRRWKMLPPKKRLITMLIRIKTMELGLTKARLMWMDAQNPVYEPVKTHRTGKKRSQKRVRGRLVPLQGHGTTPQRTRKALV